MLSQIHRAPARLLPAYRELDRVRCIGSIAAVLRGPSSCRRHAAKCVDLARIDEKGIRILVVRK